MGRGLIILFSVWIIAGNLSDGLSLVAQSNNRNSYSGRMGVDSALYVKSGRELVAHRRWFPAPDPWHSQAMQWYVAAVFRAVKNPAIDIFIVKILNWLYWGGLLTIFYFVSREIFGDPLTALFLTAILSCQSELKHYCAIVQYEVPLALVFALSFALFVFQRESRGGQAVHGAILALAYYVRFPYLVVFLGYAGFFFCHHRRVFPWFVMGFITLFGLIQAWGGGEPVIAEVKEHLARYLVPSSRGMDFPYPSPSGSSGLAFVLHSPGLYAKLLLQKGRYLFGFHASAWFLDSLLTIKLSEWFSLSIENARAVSAFGLVATLGMGTAVFFRREDRKARWAQWGPIWLYPAALILPELVEGSSPRHLIPVRLFLFLIQMLGVAKMLEWSRKNIFLLAPTAGR